MMVDFPALSLGQQLPQPGGGDVHQAGDGDGGPVQGGEAVKGLDHVFYFDHCPTPLSSISAMISLSFSPR